MRYVLKKKNQTPKIRLSSTSAHQKSPSLIFTMVFILNIKFFKNSPWFFKVHTFNCDWFNYYQPLCEYKNTWFIPHFWCFVITRVSITLPMSEVQIRKKLFQKFDNLTANWDPLFGFFDYVGGYDCRYFDFCGDFWIFLV